MRALILFFSLSLANMSFASQQGEDHGLKGCKGRKSIAGIVAKDPNFSTLLVALKEAGLVGALNGRGPFTVFAPTNDAFDKLPEGALEALLADKEALKNVLLFHVVGDKLSSQEVAGMNTLTMLNGEETFIDINADGVFIENAQITAFDIKARNGIVHVIDEVILP